LIRLAIRVRREHAELVLAELLELAPSGVEEVAAGEDLVEYAVYGPPGELPALPDLEAAAGGALVQVTSTEIADDWSERWREFHRPLVLGERLTVRPPWEPVPTPSALRVSPGGETSASRSNSIDIVIDPGQAFGTGAHATTRLCLELMLEGAFGASENSRGRILGSFLDLGCGSGVLAIAAAKLGWSPVLALDYDPASVTATAENGVANGLRLEVRRHDLRSEPTPPAGTIAANLLGPLLIEWADRLRDAPELPRRVIASGLLVTESERVAAAFAPLGLRVAQRRERGEWAALLLSRDRS
jgi:ribosomal protein L11 methyltransferase